MTIYLPEEQALQIFVNQQPVATLMATPGQLRQLAIGHMINTGIIKDIGEIARLYACDDESEIYVEIDSDVRAFENHGLITSGCGAKPVLPEKAHLIVTSEYGISFSDLQFAVVRMLQENTLYQKYGGIHTAALSTRDDFLLAEDVGRHNAQDKVTGIAQELAIDLRHSVILSTGRISSDMVAKAIFAGVPILASLSLPTKLARDLAHRYGVTLVGRAGKTPPMVITHPERIIED